MPSRGGRGGRAPSKSWGRLKPVEQDPLEAIGLPSKGDTRLLNHEAQRKYYVKIIERYLAFCTDAGEREELLRRCASLELDTGTAQPGSGAAPAPTRDKDISDVLMALRKLREGLVASKRHDEFTVQVYLFCIRVSIMAKQPEAYHPAILRLIRWIHPRCPLTAIELQEVVGYLVLDAACRRGQLAEAFEIRREFQLQNDKINMALKALVHDNYVMFEKMRRVLPGHCARIMEYARKEVRLQTLKCFGRTYMSVELDFLEAATDSAWEDLTKRDGVGWELDGSRVVIRKVKAR
ncbi:hypothetical protein B0I35DRAFT_73101 [Stachybotrys elegans]|uniref:CSN8/PSMD8/EIF3K domain-containing protein n=1 Tax=Stachybotrys elegans TaxID=80388 RepID=A0A8K0WNZ3_9HYPO|nr:hypothetical protein B0I35DRAFT_73101 [Stachybotrys elegans]